MVYICFCKLTKSPFLYLSSTLIITVYMTSIAYICTQMILTILMQNLNSYMCLLAHVEVVFSVLSFVLLLSHLLVLSLPHHRTFPSLLSPAPSPSVSLSFSFCFLSLSCLFHRALQHLRINKLYISLCTHSKAPFRKGTKLVCP